MKHKFGCRTIAFKNQLNGMRQLQSPNDLDVFPPEFAVEHKRHNNSITTQRLTQQLTSFLCFLCIEIAVIG